MLSDFFRCFFYLDLPFIILWLSLVFILTAVFGIIGRRKSPLFFHRSCQILFLVTLYVILGHTLLWREPAEHRLVLLPFNFIMEGPTNPELYRSMLMNVFFFRPMGLILGVLLVDVSFRSTQFMDALPDATTSTPDPAISLAKSSLPRNDSVQPRADVSSPRLDSVDTAQHSTVPEISHAEIPPCSAYRLNHPLLCCILFGALLSIFIEVIQFVFSLGRCETDDVMMNTLGTALGTLAPWLVVVLRRRRKRAHKEEYSKLHSVTLLLTLTGYHRILSLATSNRFAEVAALSAF